MNYHYVSGSFQIVSTGDPSENESEDSTALVDPSNVLKRRLTLPLASPLRKTQTDYATKMEREAFDKISQWKTKFASKLEDILRKGADQETEEKNKQVKKSIVLDIPLNLSQEQLQNLKKNMINELKQKSSQGDVKEILLTPKESRRFKPKIKKYPSNVADEFKQISTSDVHKEKKLDPSELLERLHYLQRQTRRDEPTSSVARGFDGISDAREKIAELLHWHDQERNNLQREMETLLAVEKPSSSSSSSLPQMSIEKESLEKVFLSLQAVTDTIFRETISRLKGTIDNGIVTGGKHKDEIPSKKVDKVEKSHQVVDDKLVRDAICQTSPSQIPVPVKRNRSPKARSSSKGFKSTEGKDMTSKGHVPNHVHTTSIGEHFCHKETCVGVEDDTESSLYTAEESSAHSCECDFASEGNSPSEKELSTSDSYGNKYWMLSCSTTTGELESSSSTMKSLESDAIESKKRRKKIGQFPYDSSDEETGEAEVSDACSEIADLLGVYRVYNLNNDRDGELTRPQAPEPMTYEERDAFEKVRRQKIQLKSNKRKIREFKSKNKRLKEQVKQLEIQQREWREDFLIKDNRISDLKREVDHLSFVMQKYKKALEDKSNIIKHKEKQIIQLLQSESDDSGDRSREMERQLKKALDDNIRLQLKLNNKGDGGEPVFSYENTSSSEFQANLESAYRRTSELEQELKESKMKLSKYIAEKESIFGENDGNDIVDELKEIINQKDKKIKELRNQHNEEVQELTQEISVVMTERDRLVQELSEIRPLKESENLEKNNLALKEEIRQLAKALADAEAKCKEKAEGNGMSVFLEQTQDHPVTDGREQELKLLKTAVEGYKLMIQRLLGCKGIGNQKEENLEYQEKLGTMARLAYERCERLESELKEAVAAKDNETVKLQETEIRLQKADKQLQNINNLVYTSQSGSLEELKNKLQMLEEENFQLKKQITPASERANGATFLIEITELQAKLAQSDLEIKELQHKLNDAEARLRQARTATALEAGASSFSNYAFTDKKYDSLAQRYKRQWDEEAELHQQELDEMRGVYRNQAPPPSREKEVYKLRQDLKTIKEALDDIVKGQGRTKSDLHNELERVLEEKEKEMVRQESIYKQMMETREKLFSELLNEKNQIIQMLKDQSHKEVNPDLQSDVIAKKIKALMEKDLTPKLDELKIQMESVITKSDEMVQSDMVSDALKKNDSKMTQIEKSTEETWSKVKDELAELKDFTFEMADAIEKDIFSSHEQFLDFVKCTSDDIIKCVTDEGHVTRKSVLDQLQATRQSRDATKFEEFYNSLDTFGKRNSRELRQARRDVLLAAEAVTNTADELHHLKTALETKFSVNDVVNKDELARRIQLINTQEEVKELRKTVSDAQLAAEALQKMEQEYAEKAKSIESNLLMKEMKFVDLVNTDQGGNDGVRRNPLFSSQDDERLRDTFYSSASSSGEMQGPSRVEDDHRRGYNSLISQTLPSRDYVTLRERLQKKAKEKLISEGKYARSSDDIFLSVLFIFLIVYHVKMCSAYHLKSSHSLFF